MIGRRARIRRLARNERGATIVEFALIAPTLILVIMGVFDLGYHLYSITQLEGAVQRAARGSSIEGADAATIDANVKRVVWQIVPNATVSFRRRAYSDYAQVGRPEDFSDVNENGLCDAGEPFEDANDNRSWDRDRGRTGSSGARDAVLYEVTIAFKRPFPIAGIIGVDPQVTAVARTLLRNQPYDVQSRTTAVGQCE